MRYRGFVITGQVNGDTVDDLAAMPESAFDLLVELGAPWGRIVRAFEGVEEYGLSWDECANALRERVR